MHWPMKWDLKVYYILLISSCEKVVSKKYSISKGRSSTKPWLFRVIFLKCFFLYSDDDDIYIFVFLIVLEVNASSSRNGRQVLTNLREATQSHDVRKRDGGTNNLVWQKQSSQQESNGLFFQFVLLLPTTLSTGFGGFFSLFGKKITFIFGETSYLVTTVSKYL